MCTVTPEQQADMEWFGVTSEGMPPGYRLVTEGYIDQQNEVIERYSRWTWWQMNAAFGGLVTYGASRLFGWEPVLPTIVGALLAGWIKPIRPV